MHFDCLKRVPIPEVLNFGYFHFSFHQSILAGHRAFSVLWCKKTLHTSVQLIEPQTNFLQSKMIKLGHSKPWQDALEQLTGERKMSARPILQVLLGCHLRLKSINQAPSNFYLKGIFGNNTGVGCIGAPSS